MKRRFKLNNHFILPSALHFRDLLFPEVGKFWENSGFDCFVNGDDSAI
jgi:hypothetical protein